MGEIQSLSDESPENEPSDIESEDQGEQSEGKAEVGKAFRKLVEKEPGFLAQITAMGMTSTGNPLYEKMTPEHISKVIELSSKHDENQYDLHKRTIEHDHTGSLLDRGLGLVIFLVIVGVVVFVVLIFRDKPDVLVPTLTGIGGFVGGFMGGWGFGSKKAG